MTKFSQKSLPFRVKQFIEENHLLVKGDRVLVAVSGGPDSVCLFDLLYRLKDELEIELAIAHYNHRQRGREADGDEKFVVNMAEKRGVKCFVGRNEKKKKLSEEQARELRYQFLGESLGEWSGDKVAIGHTANDQAETVIMRLIRGAGILGLSAIPFQREKICRPLLDFSRKDVLEYLLSQKLDFRLDSSNDSLDFNRNRIRKNVIPELIKINNQAINNISSSASRLAVEEKLLDELVKNQYQKTLIDQSVGKVAISAKKLSQYSPALRLEILKIAIKELNSKTDISSRHLKDLASMIENNVGNKKISPKKGLQISLNRGIVEIKNIFVKN